MTCCLMSSEHHAPHEMQRTKKHMQVLHDCLTVIIRNNESVLSPKGMACMKAHSVICAVQVAAATQGCPANLQAMHDHHGFQRVTQFLQWAALTFPSRCSPSSWCLLFLSLKICTDLVWCNVRAT